MRRLAYPPLGLAPVARPPSTRAREQDTVRRNSNTFLLLLIAIAGTASSACQSGGVGDPCIPEDEYDPTFPGYQATETNVESQSFQCETRTCLVTNFQGRVSCPYGQDGPGASPGCYIPGTPKSNATQIQAQVSSQLKNRRPDDAVYCSCRCDGPDPAARYCDCPSGFTCQKLVQDIGKGHAQLSGSYCVKEGSVVTNPQSLANGTLCSSVPGQCGDPNPDNQSQ